MNLWYRDLHFIYCRIKILWKSPPKGYHVSSKWPEAQYSAPASLVIQ